ncbi:hypothetical protein ZHAS_00021448 [Anopheles sinensis]|uniref:Uncharacterized protein n=1 Tax=Anopheles sinensis TaxID=74873 RepID=A0A084WSF6_ANOSI|nr:hypothetical protein ZHAS_00021448 [Anopheles sinensis]
MNLQQVVLSLGVFVTLLRDRCYGDEDTEHVHIKLHVPEIINRHVHVKTKYMHVYHPKKIVQEMPPTFPEQQQHQQLIDPAGMWMPSGAMAAAAPPLAPTSAMAAAFSSMVQRSYCTVQKTCSPGQSRTLATGPEPKIRRISLACHTLSISVALVTNQAEP